MRSSIVLLALLAALGAGGVMLVANGAQLLGIVLLVLVGLAGLVVVPFALLNWIYHRGEKLRR